MSYRTVAGLLGALVLVIGVSMVFGLFWSGGSGERETREAFLISMSICLLLGIGLITVGRRPTEERVLLKEGLAVVAIGWILAALLGAMPFVFSGTLSPIDAFFESMSGFTTTGSTVMTDIESAPRGVLFWRSFTHWLGGIGIVVLFIAILPQMGVGARHLFRSEIPGVSKEGMSPRIKDTALYLLGIYSMLTITLVLLLLFQGMSSFDAFCQSFGTVATAGFSTRNASIAGFESVGIEMTIVFFMVVSGTNFSLYLLLLRRHRRRHFFRDPELRVYLAVLVGATLLITADLLRTGIETNAGQALRYGLFQTAAIQTTTGFTTANFETWPSFSRLLLVLLMIAGGSSGSTAGGMKIMRVIVLAKYAYAAIYHWFRPHGVRSMRVGGAMVRAETVHAVLGFSVIYLGVFAGAAAVMALLGLDLISSTTSVLATLGNIGPGLASVGASESFAHVPALGKLVLSTCMLLGRLELFTLMVLFVPAFWRR